jgi:hypothetical protein
MQPEQPPRTVDYTAGQIVDTDVEFDVSLLAGKSVVITGGISRPHRYLLNFADQCGSR